MMTEFDKEILERMRYQRRKASGEFKRDVWIMINQACITASLTRQGRLYFPLSEEVWDAIPIDEFIAEMQKRGYTVWENERKKTLMVDMNLPEMGDEVFEVWRKRDCVPQSRE